MTLATVDAASGTHQVPSVFVMIDDTIWIAIDDKPKTSRRLRRLANIAGDSRVTVLAHHYESDWSALWWVRVDGGAELTETPGPGVETALVEKYPQLTSHTLGPWIRITVERVSGWEA